MKTLFDSVRQAIADWEKKKISDYQLIILQKQALDKAESFIDLAQSDGK